MNNIARITRMVILVIFASAFLVAVNQMSDARQAELDRMTAQQEQVYQNYRDAKAAMVKHEAVVFKSNGCSTKPSYTSHLLVRVEAPGESYDPYRVVVVQFDKGIEIARHGGWIVGYCNK